VTGSLHRRLAAVLVASLVFAVGCGSSARLSAVGGPTSPTPPARGRPIAPLYVIPLDSLRTLAEGTPVEVVLRSGGKVLGTSFQPQPEPSDEFHVRATPRRMFEPPDTVRMPIAGIELAVSTVPLVSGSPLYAGSQKLRPLARPGELEAQMRPTIILLTIVAIGGAIALLGVLVAQEAH
jgi:hypothetical protein